MTGARWRPLWLAVLVVVLDRVTKHLIERHVEFWEEIKVIPGFFQIVHTRNTGIAFGMFQSAGGESSPMLIAFGLLVMAFMATLFWSASKDPTREHWTLRYGLGLVMGGAIGNLYDRIMIGSVTDFFDFYWGSHHFPIFNVADSAITVGAGLLILNLWAGNRKSPATATN